MFIPAEQAAACKDLLYPKQLDKQIVASYAEIYVATVERIQILADSSHYAAPFEATFKVVKALKGDRKPGTSFEAKTSEEDARARYPIDLMKGSTYLLFFNRNRNDLEVPRYGSYFKKIGTSEGDNYIRDVERIVTDSKTK